MKILFYFGGFSPVGGIETSARNLLCALKTRDFDVQMVCWGAASPLLEELERTDVHVERVFWRWGCRYNLPDWLMLPAAMRALRDAEVVLFGKPVPRRILRVIRRLVQKDARLVLITPYRPHVPKDEANRKSALALYDAYDSVWVQSPLFKSDLLTLGYRKRVEVIPYLPEPSRPVTHFPVGPIGIGFLGRLVEDKNLPLLLEAFRLLQQRVLSRATDQVVESPRLDLYGDGHLRTELESKVMQLGLGSCVRFHGAVPQRDVADAVASCHLFVFTSRVEGQCLAGLEILGCGRPIVATGAGAFPDILQDQRLGQLVIGNSAALVADAIEQVLALIDAGETTPESVQAAYQETFGVDQIGDRYAELLHACRS